MKGSGREAALSTAKGTLRSRIVLLTVDDPLPPRQRRRGLRLTFSISISSVSVRKDITKGRALAQLFAVRYSLFLNFGWLLTFQKSRGSVKCNRAAAQQQLSNLAVALLPSLQIQVPSGDSCF